MIEKMHTDNSANNRSQGTLRAPAAERWVTAILIDKKNSLNL
jgi:hypothetical protein